MPAEPSEREVRRGGNGGRRPGADDVVYCHGDGDRRCCQSALIPQFFFMTLGITGASAYLLRLARGPHVTWRDKSSSEPWNQLEPTYQYKRSKRFVA
ncbi:hypothetical protein CRUP_003306 [Coryphaenoides rupestris]|nr:hypothetical protein CRUP_003306 [Coryphaenoides rupestris]